MVRVDEELGWRYPWHVSTNIGGKYPLYFLPKSFQTESYQGVTFIHGLKIAHRVSLRLIHANPRQRLCQCQDLFFTNFLVDWQPESLRSMTVAASKPRVHIIDFEFAVQFSEDTLPEACVCPGETSPRWCGEDYARPYPGELFSGKPYCPFKLDIWQLGDTFTVQGLKVCHNLYS